MNENLFYYGELLAKHLRGELAPAETGELNAWLAASPAHRALYEELLSKDSMAAELRKFDGYDEEGIWEKLRQKLPAEGGSDRVIPTVHRVYFWKKYRWMAAASIVLMLAAGSYFLFLRPDKQPVAVTEPEPVRFQNDIPPGTDKAVLLMSDGRQVMLDGKSADQLLEKDGSAIKAGESILTYDEAYSSGEMVYNTLQVPRKGEFRLSLSDGTQVRLNSASSIHYPTVFKGSERKVIVTGETYFEVAKDASKPFLVEVNGAEIKVLGTHFNVNAYANEAVIRTTLVEGSVTVSNNGQAVTIKPGEQARITENGNLTVAKDINTDKELAWVNGFFHFEKTGIESVMKQVERWYDVQVVYEDKTTQTFNGKIPKKVNVSDIFRILEATGWVHFRIEGSKVTVLK